LTKGYTLVSGVFPEHSVIASATPNNVKNIEPRLNQNGKIRLDVQFLWDKGDAYRRFLAGKRVA